MNDIRRTILWVIFGITMVMLWDQWQVYNGQKPTFFPAPPSKTASAPQPASSGVPTASAAAPAAGVGQLPGAAPAAPHELITVSTDVLKLTFDTEGGSLVRSEMLGHRDGQHPDQNVVLLDTTAKRVYRAQSGLIGAPAGAAAYPTHETVMTAVPGPRELAKGQDELTVRFESPERGGLKVVKTYTLKRGAYDMAVRHEVQNVSAAPQSPRLYLQLVRDGNKPEGESSFYFTFTGPVVYTGEKKYQKAEFSDIEKGKADFEKRSKDGYVAMVQHYFASAWFLGKPGAAQQDVNLPRELFMRKVDTNLYAVGMIADGQAIAPGATVSTDATLFVGPQKEKLLEQLAPGLELVKDYGWVTIFAKPLYWLLDQLHKLLGNWGWAIVGLTFIVKLIFYWPTAKGYESMAKMKAVNPKIMEMRERLKDNPQQMQQEMLRIYREEKVNPMGGCLPMVLPIPIFIALYWVLLSSVEMRGAPWAMWIHDLATPDPYFVLPAIMAVTMLLQTALNPAPPDPVQAKMMWIMPIMFSVMFFFFPAGLVLYYIVNNVLSIAQQWIINKRMGVPPQFNLPKFK